MRHVWRLRISYDYNFGYGSKPEEKVVVVLTPEPTLESLHGQLMREFPRHGGYQGLQVQGVEFIGTSVNGDL